MGRGCLTLAWLAGAATQGGVSVPRIVIIGYGAAGRIFHAPIMRTTPGLALAGVCVRDPGRRAEASADLGCRLWDDFTHVLADPAVDLVVVATPSALHVEQALAALGAGKHVIVDKPVCLDPADLDRLEAAATAAGRSLIVYQNRRWDGDFRTVGRLLAAGVLGRPRVVEMGWGGPGAAKGWRATVAAGGGRLYDLGAHMVDQLCLLMPSPPVSVYCRMHHDLAQEVESHVHLVIGFADGATGVIETGYTAIPRPRFRVLGSAGEFEKHGLDPQEAALKAGDVDSAREDPDCFGTLVVEGVRTRVPTVAGSWRGFYEAVRDHLVGGSANPVPIAAVRAPVTVLAAALRSARSGTIERV